MERPPNDVRPPGRGPDGHQSNPHRHGEDEHESNRIAGRAEGVDYSGDVERADLDLSVIEGWVHAVAAGAGWVEIVDPDVTIRPDSPLPLLPHEHRLRLRDGCIVRVEHRDMGDRGCEQ